MALLATNDCNGVGGRDAPAGYTVTDPAADSPATVTFSATAATPDDGTPPRPDTCTVTAPCAATAPFGAPTPVPVSSNRTEGTAINIPPFEVAADASGAGKAVTGIPRKMAPVATAI